LGEEVGLRIEKEVVVMYFILLSQYCSAEGEEIDEMLDNLAADPEEITSASTCSVEASVNGNYTFTFTSRQGNNEEQAHTKNKGTNEHD
jgi:hypothetical protein